MRNLDIALPALLKLVAAGVEYPDAEWKVARDYQVDSTELRQAYDLHCMNVVRVNLGDLE